MHAIELLKARRDHLSREPLGQFAAELLAEIEADRDVLAGLAETAGFSAGGLKEWSAWLGERVSRLKLKYAGRGGLGTFEALEFLDMGIHGKWVPGRASSVVAERDLRFEGIDFEHLASRAKNQQDRVDERRLECARSALCPPSE